MGFLRDISRFVSKNPRPAISGIVAMLMMGALLLPASSASAEVTISVAPSFLEFAADPGTSFTEVITVGNEGDETTGIGVSVDDTTGSRAEISAVDWITAEPELFELPPGESQEVTLSVNVPVTASVGGRFATIFFRTIPQSAVLSGRSSGFEGGSGFGAKIGSAFLLTVRGSGLRLDGTLAKVVPVALGPGRLGFRTEITNTGNVHMVLQGQLQLFDSEGNSAGEFALPETIAVLPGNTMSFRMQGFQDVAASNYTAAALIQYGCTQRQSEAAEVDPTDWTVRQTDRDIVFNSAPKMSVKNVTMEITGAQRDVLFKVEYENTGDVEVSPAGVLVVRDSSDEKFIEVNIGQGSVVVQPGGTANSEHTDSVLLPKGEYTVDSVFNYFGDQPAELSISTTVADDVIPVVAPEAPAVRQRQFELDDGGIPIWVWGVGGAVALLIAVVVVVVVMRSSQGKPEEDEGPTWERTE